MKKIKISDGYLGGIVAFGCGVVYAGLLFLIPATFIALEGVASFDFFNWLEDMNIYLLASLFVVSMLVLLPIISSYAVVSVACRFVGPIDDPAKVARYSLWTALVVLTVPLSVYYFFMALEAFEYGYSYGETAWLIGLTLVIALDVYLVQWMIRAVFSQAKNESEIHASR